MISHINKVTSLSTFNLITKHEPTVIYFYKNTCTPCQSIAPKLEAIAKNNLHFAFIKVDIQKSPEIAFLFNIQLVPSFVVLERQKPVLSGCGTTYLNDVKKHIEARK